jgi:hypothetical protein
MRMSRLVGRDVRWETMPRRGVSMITIGPPLGAVRSCADALSNADGAMCAASRSMLLRRGLNRRESVEGHKTRLSTLVCFGDRGRDMA